MVNVKSKKCAQEGCNTIPFYNLPGSKQGLYCVNHKKEGMVDVIHQSCKMDHCDTLFSNKLYKGYCLNCFINMFPGEKVARNYKTKEAAVAEYIMNNEFQQYDWVWDKRIQDGCSRRRPDLLLDLGDQVIIVEVDENQHSEYDCSCENKRLMQLSKDIGHRKLVFIRFNPDEYFKRDKSKVTGCWGINGNGILIVKKTKKKEWAKRLSSLKEYIEYWISHKTDKTVEVVQLWFDGCE